MDAPQPKPRWGIPILLGIGVLVNYLDRVNLSVARDALHSEFGLSILQFGYLSSAFNWTYAAAQLPMGVLLDRFGVQTLGRIGTLLWSVATFGSALAPGIGTFFSMRMLLGLGEAPTFPSNAKAISACFPREQRGLPTAIFDGASKFASAVGVLVIGWMILHLGWRLSFAATGLISFLYFVAFWIFYREMPPERAELAEREETTPLIELLRQKKILGLVIGFFGYNYCFYLLLFWMPTYFSTLKTSPTQSLVFTASAWLFATATDLFVGGWLVDALIRRGFHASRVRQTILITGSFLGLSLIGTIFTRQPLVAMMWLCLSLGGLAAVAPVGWSIPGLIAPRNCVGKVGGILNFGNQLSGIVSPIVTGYLAGPSAEFGKPFLVGSFMLLVGIASYVFWLGEIEPITTETRAG